VNSNFELLEAGIVADRVRLTSGEANVTALQAQHAIAGTLARYTVASLAALDAISTAVVGDTARFSAAPSTGIAFEGLEAVAILGAGATIDWRFTSDIQAATKANLDTFIAAVIAISDLATGFAVGGLAFVTGTGILYRFTTTAGVNVIAPASVDLTPTVAVSAGTAPVDATGRVNFSGITTLATLRLNCDKATLALFSRVHLLVDMECGAGQTVTYILRLADGATVNSAVAYSTHGFQVSAGVSSILNATGTSWGLSAARRYHKDFRYEFSDLAIAHETTTMWRCTSFDIGNANPLTVVGGTLGHTSAALAADGWELTFTITGGATASGTIRVIGEL